MKVDIRNGYIYVLEGSPESQKEFDDILTKLNFERIDQMWFVPPHHIEMVLNLVDNINEPINFAPRDRKKQQRYRREISREFKSPGSPPPEFKHLLRYNDEDEDEDEEETFDRSIPDVNKFSPLPQNKEDFRKLADDINGFIQKLKS